MKKLIFLTVLFVSIIQIASSQSQLTTFILVRHAEKGSDGTDDPDLKPEGFERSKKLAALFAQANIDAVYSTRFKRTKNTVTPLAQSKGLDVQVYESLKPDAVDELITKYAGKTVVVGGHSNTIPQIANALLGRNEFQQFQDSEYGNILVITVVKRGEGTVVKLSY